MSVWSRSAACCVAELAPVGETKRSIDPSGAAAALGRSSSSGYLDGDLAMAIRRARDGDQLASQQGDFVTAAACAGALAWNALLVGDWSGAAVVGDDQPVALERSEDDACVIAKHT